MSLSQQAPKWCDVQTDLTCHRSLVTICIFTNYAGDQSSKRLYQSLNIKNSTQKKNISWYRGFGLLLSRHPLSRGTRCVTVVNAWWVPPTRYHRPCRNRWEEYKEIRKGLVHWRVCSVCWQEGTWLSIAFCQRYLSSSVHTDCPLYLRVFSIIRIGCVTSSLGFRNITNIKTKMSVELPNVIFVLGGPGAGKGTQCAKIVEVEKAMR